MSLLADHQKRLLLQIARRALILAAESGNGLEDLPQRDTQLIQSAGAFVTLHRRGRLRGCIGQLGSPESLVRVVAYCARAAALEDPRFEPVRMHEVSEIEIELSVLSGLEDVAPGQIETGRHGLLVSRGWQRGVLLPQVAKAYGWTPIRFLEETCAKAGLDRNVWQDSATRIQGFTAEIFSESTVAPETEGERLKPGYSSST
jgi:AmmeMemoRadiSam system protein A